MIRSAVLLVAAFATLARVGHAGAAEKAEAACLPATAAPEVGASELFHVPAPKATELNTAAKTLYRQGKWEEARAQYRAALAVDPDFLAPRLNVACAFVRQERFAEATAEGRALIERAYVPWAREVLEAADMGALKVRPEMEEIRRTMAAAAAKWGEGLTDGVVFVARQRPPLRVPPTGEGVFILNPHQEVYAFLPATGLFRQLTAEDGRVIGVARSGDGRRVAYVTAEKLVRGAGAADLALRGVALGELVLATMTASPLVRVDGDVRRLEIDDGPAGFVYRVAGERSNTLYRRGAGDALVPVPGRGRAGLAVTVVTSKGGATLAPASVRAGCASARPKTAGGIPVIVVSAPGRPPRILGDKLGAGLGGLPLP